MQGTRGYMDGGRGENRYIYTSTEKNSHPENTKHFGEREGTTEKGFIFYSYYLIVPCNIPVIKDCNN